MCLQALIISIYDTQIRLIETGKRLICERSTAKVVSFQSGVQLLCSKLDMHRDEALFEKQALTLYSLYKQCKEGDADEFESNRKRTDPDKF